MKPLPLDDLPPCPLCKRLPERNGRGGVGGVLCPGGIGAVGTLHRLQTYGADQAEADASWRRLAALAQTEARHD